jgi:lipopolysaccharide/colanic/teichoic acid biosynthesis glycosyltransferase
MIRITSYLNSTRWFLAHPNATHDFSRLLGRMIKRGLDISASLVAIIVLSPLLLLACFLIKRDSPGPLFFRGKRVGRGGRVFKILKFRTMYESPESYAGPPLTCREDARITPLGRWLRDTKLNEMPQLWNVLKGEMSLVGPRPEDPEVAAGWENEIRAEILSIHPGITSPASILYHDEESLLSGSDLMGMYINSILPDKLRLDRLYVRNHSFFSDLDIIFWTFAIFLPRIAKTRIPEINLFSGPISRLTSRHLSWFFVDLFSAMAVAVFVGLIWRSQGPLNWGIPELTILAGLLALLFSGLNAVTGVNRVIWSRATMEDGFSLVLSVGLITALALLGNGVNMIYPLIPYPSLPTSMILFTGLLSLVVFITTRYRLRLVSALAGRWLSWRQRVFAFGERVLIIGSGEGCQVATWMLKRGIFGYAFTIVGIVDDEDPRRIGMKIDGSWVLGTLKEVPDLVRKYDVGVIISTIPYRDLRDKNQVLDICCKSDARVVFLGDLLSGIYEKLVEPTTSLDYGSWVEGI